MSRIDRRATKVWRKGFLFAPFQVRPGSERELIGADLRPETELLLLARGGRWLAFLLTQMAYHHVAQGELAGAPYLVTF